MPVFFGEKPAEIDSDDEDATYAGDDANENNKTTDNQSHAADQAGVRDVKGEAMPVFFGEKKPEVK